ncbi:MAG: radical SAM protein [Hellea sp.]|nr:radical SAM protein [Hellea sp.]
MNAPIDPSKFKHPLVTAKGETRATVEWDYLKTLWLNTGSLCNITCANCYIESSPTADHFAYLTPDDVGPYLDEIDDMGIGKIEIGMTGGEPCMNPYFIALCEMALERGHSLLILTNAMKPLIRPRVQAGLLQLFKSYGPQMTFRVSLDHFTAKGHDTERGMGSFDIAVAGMNWFRDHGFNMHIAGRAMFSESEDLAREGYADLITRHNWDIDAADSGALMLFPEMDDRVDVPEITTACWDILSIDPRTMMCANSRMLSKRKGANAPVLLSCTLLWDDPQFEMGTTLRESLKPVSLNHPHCAKFCVLGGASCSG